MSTPLQELKAAALKCTRCGQCLTICPVFGKTGEESNSSRGKLFMLRALAEGSVQPTEHLMELAARCTLCMRCKSICPSGVDTTGIILELRRHLAEQGHLPLAKRLAFKAVTRGRLFDMVMSNASPFQSLLFRRNSQGTGAVARLPIPAAGLNLRRLVPELAAKPLRKLVPAVSKPAGATRARVALFPGCMLSYVYVEAGKALVDVLVANGVEVHLPDALQCCGTPLYSSGDVAGAASLAEANVRALASGGYDAVVTGCATCGSALLKEYGHVLQEGRSLATWQNMKDKVMDVSDFLLRLGPEPYSHNVPLTATYHDACHLVRGMGVSKQPRSLIRSIPGLRFTEMNRADVCCGCAGTFSATHYGLSQQILADKVDDIMATGADVVVTGCSACKMQILDGIAHKNARTRVLHTAELLARAYGL